MATTTTYLSNPPLTFTNPADLTSTQLVGTNLTYPSNLDTSNYYMMFQFVQYERPNIFSGGFNRAVGGVALPMPVQLKDVQTLNFSQDGNNPAVGAAIENTINAGKTASGNSFGLIGGVISGIKDTILGTAAGAGITGANVLASKVGTSVNQVLSLNGQAVNPFLTVLFNSPTFKKHTLSWRFTPSNATDSNLVAAITNAFKYHSLPDISGATAGTLLSYPDMVYISIYPENDFMYRFKPCVIEGVSVDYAAGGTPSFFTGTKAPTCVDLTISFLEIEYHLKKDWTINYDGTLSQTIRSST